MKLNVLVDNNTIIDRYYTGEPGVSYLLSHGQTKILFDLGYSDAFIRNARQMDENLLDIDYVVISHGHNDHTGGLVDLIKYYAEARAENLNHKKPTVIAHPDAFNYKEEQGNDIGSLVEKNRLQHMFNTHLTSSPFWITKELISLAKLKG